MDTKTKNRFFKYIGWCALINLTAIGGLIPSIYFFVMNYTNYFNAVDGVFWVGYGLIIAMILTIAAIVLSFSIMVKLIYDYRWRIKQGKKEIINA